MTLFFLVFRGERVSIVSELMHQWSQRLRSKNAAGSLKDDIRQHGGIEFPILKLSERRVEATCASPSTAIFHAFMRLFGLSDVKRFFSEHVDV